MGFLFFWLCTKSKERWGEEVTESETQRLENKHRIRRRTMLPLLHIKLAGHQLLFRIKQSSWLP